MVKQFTITFDDWVADIIEKTAGKNKSQRVQELALKGYMQEQEDKAVQEALGKLQISVPEVNFRRANAGPRDLQMKASEGLSSAQDIHATAKRR